MGRVFVAIVHCCVFVCLFWFLEAGSQGAQTGIKLRMQLKSILYLPGAGIKGVYQNSWLILTTLYFYSIYFTEAPDNPLNGIVFLFIQVGVWLVQMNHHLKPQIPSAWEVKCWTIVYPYV